MAFYTPSFRSSSKYRPTVAEPHPPVDHAIPMAGFVLALGLLVVWVAELAFPYAAAAVIAITLLCAVIVSRIHSAIARDRRTDLYMIVPAWVGLTGVFVLVAIAYQVEHHVSVGDWIASLVGAVLGGGLLNLLPAGLLGLVFGNRAAEGGPLPPRSRARRAGELAPWRTTANSLALFNVFSVIPAMPHASSPLTSVGSLVALACTVVVVLVLVAQQAWLRPPKTPSPPEPIGPAYRAAVPPPAYEEAPENVRAEVARRELVRGIVAVVIASAVLALHGYTLFG